MAEPSDDSAEIAASDAVLFGIMQARHEGKLLHDLTYEQKVFLAKNAGIYTTCETRYPKNIAEQKTQRMLNRLANNAARAVGDLHWFKDAGEHIGPALVTVFSRVVGIEGFGLDIVNRKEDKDGKLIDGTVMAECIELTMTGRRSARKLERALKALLTPVSLDHMRGVERLSRIGPDSKRRYIVEITNFNEYDERILESAVAQLQAQWDRKFNNTVYPPIKRRAHIWTDLGETFAQKIAQRISRINQAYKLMPVKGQYVDRPEMEPIKKPDILGTTPAALFQGLRSLFKPLILEFPEGAGRNKEQNDNEEERLLIEERVKLKRDNEDSEKEEGEGLTFEERLKRDAERPGPPNPRTPNVKELGQEKLAKVRRLRARTSIKMAATILGNSVSLGLTAFIEPAIKLLPDAFDFGKAKVGDVAAYNRQKRDAINAGYRIDREVGRLMVLNAQKETNGIPQISLAALERYRKLTTAQQPKPLVNP